jgi:hypothetical protein
MAGETRDVSYRDEGVFAGIVPVFNTPLTGAERRKVRHIVLREQQ